MLTERHSISSLKMSTDIEEDADGAMFCASCGIAGGDDDNKLKNCTGCYLVKYCSVKCQRDHRPKHKRECKRRAAELRDEILFKQPESHLGDCPICCLPLPFDPKKYVMMSCCSKSICVGCNYANQKREHEGRLQQKCAFCRQAAPSTDEETIKQMMKRVEMNDPVAMRHMGTRRYHEGDYNCAFEYLTKAAALGDVEAQFQVSVLFRTGQAVAVDEKRELHHAEQAAIGGHPLARHNLGWLEHENGRYDRAVKHYIIAAKLGLDESIRVLKDGYKNGLISKDDFAAALRGHQAAIDATKSPQREAVAAFLHNKESGI